MILQRLFPEEVLTEELPWPFPDLALHDAELRSISGAFEKRRREFAAGRVCARRALERLGIREYPLLADAEGIPLWPSGVTGSISHAPDFCGTVVARKNAWRSVGFDVEQIARVHPSLWPRLFTPGERSWLEQRERDRNEMAAVLFSAKEAFFKCWYPVTRLRVDFHDVEVRLDKETATFDLHLLSSRPLDVPPHAPNGGAFLVGSRHVFTGLLWPASSPRRSAR
jgi:4'-phosphopantetheinyl transferase EntD